MRGVAARVLAVCCLCTLLVTIQSSEEKQTLHKIVETGTISQVISGLVKYSGTNEMDAVVNMPDSMGLTPIFFARDHEIAEALVHHGADVNYAENSMGWAPIHYAAQNNMLALARVLIKGGADACARSHGRYGLDALAIAAERHNVRMAKLLVHLGGCDPKSSITSSGTSSWDLLPELRAGDVKPLTDNEKKLLKVRQFATEAAEDAVATKTAKAAAAAASRELLATEADKTATFAAAEEL